MIMLLRIEVPVYFKSRVKYAHLVSSNVSTAIYNTCRRLAIAILHYPVCLGLRKLQRSPSERTVQNVCVSEHPTTTSRILFLPRQHVTRKVGEVALDGANPSAEEVEEGTEEGTESGLDLVLNMRLVETGFSKTDYKNYLKTYTKALMDKWKEDGKSEAEVNEAKSKLTEAVKKVLPRIGDMQFFLGMKLLLSTVKLNMVRVIALCYG